MTLRQEIEEKFEKKFIIPNGHFHDFFYKEHPYRRELWSNYIAEPGVDEIKDFIFSTVIPMVIEKIKENVILDGCDNLCPDKLEIFLSKLKEEGLSK